MGKNAYIRDPWNQLDFLIVLTSSLSYVLNLENITYLRIFRVLRPLKSINRIKSLRKMMVIIFSSFNMLKDTLFIMSFYFFIVAIFSL